MRNWKIYKDVKGEQSKDIADHLEVLAVQLEVVFLEFRLTRTATCRRHST